MCANLLGHPPRERDGANEQRAQDLQSLAFSNRGRRGLRARVALADATQRLVEFNGIRACEATICLRDDDGLRAELRALRRVGSDTIAWAPLAPLAHKAVALWVRSRWGAGDVVARANVDESNTAAAILRRNDDVAITLSNATATRLRARAKVRPGGHLAVLWNWSRRRAHRYFNGSRGGRQGND